MSNWTEIETSKHQDHVIAHVIGATILGWVIAGEAAHLLLDIGFLWTVYLDGEMNLLPQGVAIPELEGDDLTSADKTELSFDADLLLSEGPQASGLTRFTPANLECLIEAVEVQEADLGKRVIVKGAAGNVVIETSLASTQVRVFAQAVQAGY